MEGTFKSLCRLVGLGGRNPQRLVLGRTPKQTTAWLKIKTSKWIVFKPYARSKPEPTGNNGDFILYEETRKMSLERRWMQRKDRGPSGGVAGKTVSGSPDQVMARTHGKMMLKIYIEGVDEGVD